MRSMVWILPIRRSLINLILKTVIKMNRRSFDNDYCKNLDQDEKILFHNAQPKNLYQSLWRCGRGVAAGPGRTLLVYLLLSLTFTLGISCSLALLHFHTFTFDISCSFTLSCSLLVYLALSHFHSHSWYLLLSYTFTFTPSLLVSLALSHFHTFILDIFCSLTLSLSLLVFNALSHFHTFTLGISCSFSLSRSLLVSLALSQMPTHSWLVFTIHATQNQYSLILLQSFCFFKTSLALACLGFVLWQRFAVSVTFWTNLPLAGIKLKQRKKYV